MKTLRIDPLFWIASLLTSVSAITLLGVLQSYPELSTLYNYVNASSNLTNLLSVANNFTFLAPSNDAIASFVAQNPNMTELLVTTLEYSLLQGGYPSLSFQDTPQFVKSNLNNSNYANVTGGQVAELVLGNDDAPTVVSGNKMNSTTNGTEIVCVGGIIHIMNEVLTIPLTAVLEITAAQLEYFISILSGGGFLDTANSVYVNSVTEVPDMTFFIPNSPGALANFTAQIASTSQADIKADFEYHIVPNFVGYSTLLTDGLSLRTSANENVTITVQDNDIYVNAAKIITRDYIIANGVIHVIDDLLNRTETSGPPKPASTTSATSAPNHSSTPTPTPAATPSKSHKSTIIGIAVGVTLGALLLVAIGAFFLIRHRRRENEKAINDQFMAGMPYQTDGFYVKRSQSQGSQSQRGKSSAERGLGLQTQGLHTHIEDSNEMDGNISDGPVIPQRSPSRARYGREF